MVGKLVSVKLLPPFTSCMDPKHNASQKKNSRKTGHHENSTHSMRPVLP